jgi:ABC-type glycerol-3-phosphate transport system permease component
MQAAVKKRSKAPARRPWFWVRWGIRMLITYGCLIALAAVLVTPFLYMVSISLRPGFSFMTFPLSLIPERVSLENFQILFRQSRIARWIWNSVFVAGSVTVLQLFTCSMAGYAFGRGEFPGRDAIFWVFMGTMMVPGTVTIVPAFLLMSRLGWVDTYWALIVPAATSTFGTFLCRQSFKSIPRDYDDAALIDGANRFGIYRRVLLPVECLYVASHHDQFGKNAPAHGGLVHPGRAGGWSGRVDGQCRAELYAHLSHIFVHAALRRARYCPEWGKRIGPSYQAARRRHIGHRAVVRLLIYLPRPLCVPLLI